jgi:hypothetical protein
MSVVVVVVHPRPIQLSTEGGDHPFAIALAMVVMDFFSMK